MPLLRSLLRPFDPAFRTAREQAVVHLCRIHPGWRVNHALLRADEPDRYVFALFYADGGLPVTPGRYLIFAVGKRDASVQELPLSPDSPYWIRGLK